MTLFLFDRDKYRLEQLASELDTKVQLVVGDITCGEHRQQLMDKVYSARLEVSLLFNNAGVKITAGASDSPICGENRWRLICCQWSRSSICFSLKC